MNKIEKKYLNDCKHLFPFLSKKEKLFLKRLKENIEDKRDEKTDITYHHLCQEFGYPTDIVTSYFNSTEDMYLIKKSRISSIIKKAIIIIVISVVGVCLWRTILLYQSYEDSKNSIIDEVETTIEIIERVEK